MSTMTRPTGIKCGHCQGRHASVAEVRGCSKTVWLADVAEGRATMEEYAASRKAEVAEERTLAAAIQRREREETERVARAKMDRDGFGHEPHTAGYEAQRSWGQEKAPDLADGIYRNPQTGDIFKIYRTVHGANQTVAKRLVLLDEPYTKTSRGKEVEVRAEFVYEGKKGLRGLTSEMRMTLEEAKKYGALYGVCVRCCLTLTREESIERSMGPVCAKKANWA